MLRIAAFKFQSIAEGLLTLVPGGKRLLRINTQGSDSARYCYAVWMRHLTKIQGFINSSGGRLGTVLELGPGDSLGTGLAALLCGADRYIAVDVVEHANPQRNLQMFEHLIELFRTASPIPDQMELPEVNPLLNDYRFPTYVPRNSDLEKQNAIAEALRNRKDENPVVTYVDPSEAQRIVSSGSVDLIFSQAVLEHVDDLETVYRCCFNWLRPGGLMSHQIDFKSHGTSHEWNGHWTYPVWLWRIIRGNRPYLINRKPCGAHLSAMKAAGFEIVLEDRVKQPSRLKCDQLAGMLREMSQDDLNTAGVYIVTRKNVADSVPV
jgi:SAM-dependent methyltransferase